MWSLVYVSILCFSTSIHIWEMMYGRIHTKKIDSTLLLLASVFFFPNVINFSASRCASFAFGHVVDIDSCVNNEVTRFRSRACLCAEDRPRCLYFNRAPAIAAGVQSSEFVDQLAQGSCS
jgi:hypothetical protein